jgi:hypothetical protein
MLHFNWLIDDDYMQIAFSFSQLNVEVRHKTLHLEVRLSHL